MQIAEISTPYKKSGSRNMMVTSHFRPEIEIWPYHTCAMQNMQYNPYIMAESPKFPPLIGNQGRGTRWDIRF